MTKFTVEEVERRLLNEDWGARWIFASSQDFTPTPEQIERGLTDNDYGVRRGFAQRSDFLPTPMQVARGLEDEHPSVRQVFKDREAKWRAAWEAQELKKRYTTLTETLQNSRTL
jgi:hypothetical protein